MDRAVALLGGVPRTALPALLDDALARNRGQLEAQHREALEAQTRSVSLAGEMFVRGIENLMLGARGLNRYVEPAYSNHALVYSCMSLIAENVAAVPFKLYKKNADGTPGDPITAHPLLDLLNDPFPELYGKGGGVTFLQLLVLYMLASGNAWLLEDQAQTSKTKLPVSLTVLGSVHVVPQIDGATWRLHAWQLFWGGTPRLLPPEGLHHLKLANPDDRTQILGVGPLGAARQSVAGDFARERFDSAFFERGGAPSMKIQWNPDLNERLAPLTPDQLKAAETAFTDMFAGADRAHKIAVLNAGWRLESLGVGQRDMQFVEGFLHSTRRIAAVFRVPAVLMNDRENGGFSDQEIRAAMGALARNVTVPWCTRLSRSFQVILVDRYAPGLIGQFDTDEIAALKENFDDKVKNYVALVAQGQVPPRAAAELVDLGVDPQVLSDQALVPLTLVPVEQVANGQDVITGPAEPTAPAPNGTTPPARQARALPAPASPISGDHRLLRWRAFVATFAGLERQFHAKVRRYLFSLRKEVLQNLEAVLGGRRVRAVDDEIRRILFDERAAAERLRTLAKPYFVQAITTGAAGAAEALHVDPIGVESSAAQAFLDLKTIKVVGINDTIREALRATLSEGLAAGENMTAVAQRVRDVFDASATRARTIARTETASAVSGGTFIEYREQGVERVEWLSARDAAVRESHAEQDGAVVAIGEPFPNGLEYPGDVAGPPEEVINCRCTLVPAAES